MPIYKYEALKHGKEIIKGEVNASNLKDARDVVRKMGLVPTKVIEFNDKKLKKVEGLSPLSLSEKIDFISTLQILLQSGIPAVESLMFMEQEAAKKKIKDTSRILKTQIMAGSTFADTLARYPDVFGHIFIGLTKAGEEAGELEKTLGRIKDLLTKQANIKAKVIGTLMYPMFVIILSILVTLVMLIALAATSTPLATVKFSGRTSTFLPMISSAPPSTSLHASLNNSIAYCAMLALTAL